MIDKMFTKYFKLRVIFIIVIGITLLIFLNIILFSTFNLTGKNIDGNINNVIDNVLDDDGFVINETTGERKCFYINETEFCKIGTMKVQAGDAVINEKNFVSFRNTK